MKKFYLGKNLTAFALIWAMLVLPLAAAAQTQIRVPKNKYKIQDDVKIGRETSAQVEKQFPILNDVESTRYIQEVGNRLEAAIPQQYRQPQFNCTFKIVNARDINAFALPACHLYVNRGMIEAARNEGEMAGVMAHEISHAMLRHGTAQATQQSNPLNQILGIGAILGGAILGGETGAAIGQTIYAGLLVYPYSREYETQADILGAQILARADYDPRDLANMFRTIEQQSGGSRGPEWLSTHPNPGNRYENINREASLLRVSESPIKMTRGFERVKSKLRGLPRARSMEEIERDYKNNRGQTQPRGGRYETSVPFPSARMRTYTAGNWIQLNIPSNWQEFSSEGSVEFAPQGAYGNNGITHGALIGIYRGNSRNVADATEDYVNSVLQGNNYLRQQSGYSRISISGRQAYSTVLSGRSPVTGRTEIATVYTVMLRNGDLFYVVTVVPSDESSRYNFAFRSIINSIRLND
jgi:beta-barrel assembly-enhancing protease